MTNKLRWAILGTGMIAKKFAADLPKSEYGQLVLTGSRSAETAEAFANEFGGRGVGSYEAALQDPEVEAVYISLPNGLHAEWSNKAMEAGKHVLCEKPLARSTAEAERMFKAAELYGKVLIEAFMYRTMPAVKEVLAYVHRGDIGDLRLIRTNFTFAREASLKDARYQPDQGGGSIMDVGCYCVNFCRALTQQEPSGVHAIAHLHESGVDDYAAGTLKFGNDVLATFTCGMTVKSQPGAFIAGTEGMIEMEAFWFAQNGHTLVRPDGSREHVPAPPEKPPYASEADAFAAVVRGEAKPWIDKADTLGNMRALDKLRKSAGVPLS